MATQQPPNSITITQQARQAALTSLLTAQMVKIWPLIDLTDLSGSLPKYQAAVAALVYKYGQSSAALAAHYYQQVRTAAGVTGQFKPVPADPATFEQVEKSIGWATKGLWSPSGPQPVTAKERVVGEAKELPDEVTNAKTLAGGAAQKMVVDTGRNTLIAAIEADKKARGWAREAKPDACAFCALLATRGAVYRSEQTADFKAHSGCHCVPVPLFADHYEPPAYVRQWQADYAQATRSANGPKDARLAWRRAHEGRTDPALNEQPVNA